MNKRSPFTPKRASLPNTFNKKSWYEQNITVILQGPYSHFNEEEGTETPYYVLSLQRKCQDPTDETPHKSYRSSDYWYLFNLGNKIAKDRNIKFDNLASRLT